MSKRAEASRESGGGEVVAGERPAAGGRLGGGEAGWVAGEAGAGWKVVGDSRAAEEKDHFRVVTDSALPCIS